MKTNPGLTKDEKRALLCRLYVGDNTVVTAVPKFPANRAGHAVAFFASSQASAKTWLGNLSAGDTGNVLFRKVPWPWLNMMMHGVDAVALGSFVYTQQQNDQVRITFESSDVSRPKMGGWMDYFFRTFELYYTDLSTMSYDSLVLRWPTGTLCARGVGNVKYGGTTIVNTSCLQLFYEEMGVIVAPPEDDTKDEDKHEEATCACTTPHGAEPAQGTPSECTTFPNSKNYTKPWFISGLLWLLMYGEDSRCTNAVPVDHKALTTKLHTIGMSVKLPAVDRPPPSESSSPSVE